MVHCMVVLLPFSVFPWFPFFVLISRYVCVVVCKSFRNFNRGGDYATSFFYWWYSPWFVVSIYLSKFLPYFLGWCSGIQWIYKFVPGIFSSFPESSLFDGSPMLEGSKFIYICWVSWMFPILYSYYFLFSFALFITSCYWWSILHFRGWFSLLLVIWFWLGSYVLLQLFFGPALLL